MPEPVAPSKTPPAGDEIGEVVSFFAVPSAAIVKVQKGSLKLGDTIWISGHTTDLKQTIQSMEIDHKPVTQAVPGQEVGIQVSARVRRNDKVFKIS